MASAIAANPVFAKIHANKGMVFPLAFISLLMVLLIPLPTGILDLLLAVTLFRLVLNVATTRLILTASGTPEEAMYSAGEVVMAFSNFVTGNSLAVGIIIFLII